MSYVNRVDNTIAARYFELASRMPEAPEFTGRFAAYVYGKAGDDASSIRLWEAYKESTDSEILKELADRYIEKLQSLDTQEETAPDVQ